MSGGVAFNSKANGRILSETPVENLFIQPAAGNSGGGAQRRTVRLSRVVGQATQFRVGALLLGRGVQRGESATNTLRSGHPLRD